jgi:hypothetical protein
MNGRAQANNTHRSLLPSLQGSGKKITSGYFIATPRTVLKTLLATLTDTNIQSLIFI